MGASRGQETILCTFSDSVVRVKSSSRYPFSLESSSSIGTNSDAFWCALTSPRASLVADSGAPIEAPELCNVSVLEGSFCVDKWSDSEGVTAVSCDAWRSSSSSSSLEWFESCRLGCSAGASLCTVTFWFEVVPVRAWLIWELFRSLLFVLLFVLLSLLFSLLAVLLCAEVGVVDAVWEAWLPTTCDESEPECSKLSNSSLCASRLSSIGLRSAPPLEGEKVNRLYQRDYMWDNKGEVTRYVPSSLH